MSAMDRWDAHRRAALVVATLTALLTILSLSAGCSLSAGARPAHAIAPIGVQVLAATEAAQDTIIALGQAGRIPPEQERLALKATVAIGHAGKRLAVALRTMDAAQSAVEHARATGEVSALLDVINGLVFDAMAPFTDVSVRTQVAGLLKEVNTLLLTIAGAIARTP